MALQLRGRPLPAPPAIPGRKYRAPLNDDTDLELADIHAAGRCANPAVENTTTTKAKNDKH